MRLRRTEKERHGCLRHGCLLGLAVALAAAPALGQAPRPARPRPSARGGAGGRAPPARKPVNQLTPPPNAPAQSDSGVPRTLAEALAATYANQPALQAERAKLRATDENVPQALAGWRPTVVMAGTAGYGDGISRAGLGLQVPAQTANRPTDRHRAGNADPADLYRRQDAGQRQPRQEPGDGGARDTDRAGADQLHQHGQRLCRRHPGATVAGA